MIRDWTRQRHGNLFQSLPITVLWKESASVFDNTKDSEDIYLRRCGEEKSMCEVNGLHKSK